MNGPFEWREAPSADFAVIGDPISHSFSPKMMTAAFEALGLPYQYVSIRVPSEEFADAIEFLTDLGYRGANATVPLKEVAWFWLREKDPFMHRPKDPFSEKVMAVNTLDLIDRRGTNTDGPGFLDTLSAHDISAPATVLVLGAGGSAHAICLALSEAGYRLRLWNRTASRAGMLVQALNIHAELLEAPSLRDADLIVNATSAGLSSGDLGLDWSWAKDSAIAYDLLYGPEPTSFLRAASERGLRTVDGISLLVAQGARSLEWWLDVEVPREAMLKALR